MFSKGFFLRVVNSTKSKISTLIQIESISRQQNKCNLKTEIFEGMGRKHCWKRRKCCLPEEKKNLLVTGNFFFSQNVFKNCLLSMCQNEYLWSKGLNSLFITSFPAYMKLKTCFSIPRLILSK